jgi:hypothetical protein
VGVALLNDDSFRLNQSGLNPTIGSPLQTNSFTSYNSSNNSINSLQNSSSVPQSPLLPSSVYSLSQGSLICTVKPVLLTARCSYIISDFP